MYQDKPQKTQSDSNKLSRYFHHIPGKTSSGENITTSSSLKVSFFCLIIVKTYQY